MSIKKMPDNLKHQLEGALENNVSFMNLLANIGEIDNVIQEGNNVGILAFKVDFLQALNKVKRKLKPRQVQILELMELGYGQVEIGENLDPVASQQGIQQLTTVLRTKVLNIYNGDDIDKK